MADAAKALEALITAWHNTDEPTDKPALASWWRQIDEWKGKDSLKFTQDMKRGGIIKPQYAIQRLFEITRARNKEVVHHHRGRAAPDVGRAAFPLRKAESLDDLRRPGHHGVWPAGRDGGCRSPIRMPA